MFITIHKMKYKIIILLCVVNIISSCTYTEKKENKLQLDCEENVCDTIDSYDMFISINDDTLILKDFVIPDTILFKVKSEEVKVWVQFWQCWNCYGYEYAKYTTTKNEIITETKVIYKGNNGYTLPINLEVLQLNKNKEVNLVLTGKTQIKIK